MRIHLLAPEGFDDPGRPSGGNLYDRRLAAGLTAAGWDVRIATVAGSWPVAGRDALRAMAGVVAAIPDGETVLIDGLLASPSAAPLLPHASRLRLVVLLHMPLASALGDEHDPAGERSERAVLAAAAGVLVTSDWARRQVLGRFAIAEDRVRLARPGVDPAAIAPGGGPLLCVGALRATKGQDLLIQALARLADREWRCLLAGPLDRDQEFVARLRAGIANADLGGRIRLAGVLSGTALEGAYAAADVLVAPSRSETYGMAVTEALARGLPVIGAAVGGLPEALGRAPDGTLPGILVAPDDAAALAVALAAWLRDDALRRRLRRAALERRPALPGWDQTVRDVAAGLAAGTLRTQ